MSSTVPFAVLLPAPAPPSLLPVPLPEFRVKRVRTRLWELNGSVHCSVVGTCLSTGELRAVMTKVRGHAAVEHATDHDLHALAVGACGTASPCARLLAKALDRRHAAAIARFARVAGEAAVQSLWAAFRREGDIPGAYWAVLTHPDTGREGMRRAFGDVHMLSHLVGAANRADIRRLSALEEENARLRDKVARQQERLRLLAIAGPPPTPAAAPAPAEPAAPFLMRQLDEAHTRLAAEVTRRERAEQRLSVASGERDAAQDAAASADAEAASLRQELEVAGRWEAGDVAALIRPERVLYVGGRPGTLDRARILLNEAGGDLLVHDGGRHDNPSLLPGLMSRADRVVFPVDCVSHDAALAVKRLCRAGGKRWTPLRSSSLASFLACLAKPAPGTADKNQPECCP